jgi:hypothetical protein
MSSSPERRQFSRDGNRSWEPAPPTHPRAWVLHRSDPDLWSQRTVIAFSSVQREFAKAIELSKNLLALEHDWDDAGAKPIEPSTWKRATELLRRTAMKAGGQVGRPLPVPRISPCGDGSIDFYWKTPSFKLLVNIQPNAATQSDFYGETVSGIILKGTLPPDVLDLSVILSPLVNS